ncbi:MAG: hypothetical protein ABI887_10825 [Burkholderiales bacterium]
MTTHVNMLDREEALASFHHRYPLLFARKIGLECGVGWNFLLDEAFFSLEAEIQRGLECGDWFPHPPQRGHPLNHPPAVGWPHAEQIKEKFGSLRIYLSHHTPELDAAIRLAEERADRTCDQCGEPGSLIPRGWMRVRCAHHIDRRLGEP